MTEVEQAEDIIVDSENDDSSSLTDWVNEPKVSDLKQDFTDAKSSHETHVNNVVRWLDNLNITGSAAKTKQVNRSSITPKLIRKQAEWRYAALSEPFLSTEDLFNTAPESFEDKEAAEQAGLVLNYQFNCKIKKVAFIDEYVRTVVDEGTVIVRVGWDFEEEEQEVEVPDFEIQPIQDPALYQQAIDQGQEPFEQVQVGTHTEMQMVVIKNVPTVEVCDFNNLIIDPTCLGDLDRASFIIYSFETSLSELEKDGKYKNLDKINVTATSVLSDPDHTTKDETAFNFKDKPRKKFTAYEYWGYWDIDKTGIVKPIVATYVNDTLIRMEENPFPDQKLPFVAVQYLPVRKSIYGQPDGELLEDNQNIIGAVTRGMIDIMGRSANGQMGMRKDALDITNKRKFDKGMDYEFNPSVDARSAFYVHTFSPIPQSAEYMINQQNDEAESLTGVKAFNQGISGQAYGNTATAVRTALDATSKRELGILRRLGEGVKGIGRKIMAMNGEFLSEEEVVRVTNDEFTTIRRDDLAGNYDVELTISTAEADNEKAQDLSFMMQTMGNNMDPAMSQIILADIAKLRKMPTLAKQIEEYQPQPDPMVEEQKVLQIELLKAQIRNENAKAQENTVDVDYKKAKTKTEEAKSRGLHTKSDLDDQAYLENDQGIPHQRDMDKADMKRKADLDLKAADVLLGADKNLQGNSPNTGNTSN